MQGRAIEDVHQEGCKLVANSIWAVKVTYLKYVQWCNIHSRFLLCPPFTSFPPPPPSLSLLLAPPPPVCVHIHTFMLIWCQIKLWMLLLAINSLNSDDKTLKTQNKINSGMILTILFLLSDSYEAKDFQWPQKSSNPEMFTINQRFSFAPLTALIFSEPLIDTANPRWYQARGHLANYARKHRDKS